ncbi:MAG: hypothetical protein M1818_003650 [Claussenomyces sp. TS43310]|nr:MAG: hypothetical protein M1818_003650 [Claussenomyces sp. TS43310]
MTANDAVTGEAAPDVSPVAPAVEEAWSVDNVVAALPGGPPAYNTTSPVPFFHVLERLKTTKREGWRRFGIDRGESISDHMYRMSLITMLAPPSLAARINIPHCTKMALVHDMAEALVGDITPKDGVAKAEKSRRESTTMDYLVEGLLGRVDGGAAGRDLKAIWQEYEDGVTLESQFVHDVDKVELVLQMFDYERRHGGQLDLSEFSWVATRIALPEVRAWSDEILRERHAFWEARGAQPTGYTESAELQPELRAQQDEYYGKT